MIIYPLNFSGDFEFLLTQNQNSTSAWLDTILNTGGNGSNMPNPQGQGPNTDFTATVAVTQQTQQEASNLPEQEPEQEPVEQSMQEPVIQPEETRVKPKGPIRLPDGPEEVKTRGGSIQGMWKNGRFRPNNIRLNDVNDVDSYDKNLRSILRQISKRGTDQFRSSNFAQPPVQNYMLSKRPISKSGASSGLISTGRGTINRLRKN